MPAAPPPPPSPLPTRLVRAPTELAWQVTTPAASRTTAVRLLAAALLVATSASCQPAPRRAADHEPDPGPTAEEFCAHVDAFPDGDLGDASSDDRRAAHEVCVEASSDDRTRFPEWAPCARCTMQVGSLAELDVRCRDACAALQGKMEALLDAGGGG